MAMSSKRNHGKPGLREWVRRIREKDIAVKREFRAIIVQEDMPSDLSSAALIGKYEKSMSSISPLAVMVTSSPTLSSCLCRTPSLPPISILSILHRWRLVVHRHTDDDALIKRGRAVSLNQVAIFRVKGVFGGVGGALG